MLKSPNRKTEFCSFDISSRRLLKQLLLRSVRSIKGYSYMVPTIMFNFLGSLFQLKVDSSSYFLFMFEPSRGFYERWLAIYKRLPPAEDSVGVNSIE